MRRYSIVSRILLILSVIELALAAPVLVQERRQASVDVVSIPEDAMTVWGKRTNELDLMWEEYLKAWGKPKVPSAEPPSPHSAPPELGHGSTNVVEAPQSNSAPPELNHGSTNVGEAPQSNPASSTASPDHSLMGANTQPSNPPPPGELAPEMHVYGQTADPWWYSGEKLYTPTSSEHGSGDEIYTALPNPPNRWMSAGNPPSQRPASPTDSFDWKHWQSVEESPPRTPASPASPDSFDWAHWQKVVNSPSQDLAPATDVHAWQVARPSTAGRPGVGVASGSGFHSDDEPHVAYPASSDTVSEFSSAHGSSPVTVAGASSGPASPGTVSFSSGHSVARPPSPGTVSDFSSGHVSPFGPPTTPEALTTAGTEAETSNSALDTLNSDNLPVVNYGLKGKAKVPGSLRGIT